MKPKCSQFKGGQQSEFPNLAKKRKEVLDNFQNTISEMSSVSATSIVDIMDSAEKQLSDDNNKVY